MVELKYIGSGFTFQLYDNYVVAADNIEGAKSELFDRIEKEIDEYVNNKLILTDDKIIIDYK